MIQLPLRVLLVTTLSLALFACGQQDERSFTILSSTVHKFMEPQVMALGRRIGIDVQMTYQPSPDIANALQKGKATGFDAVWPASSLWIILGDTQGVVQHSRSIMRSPLVVALKQPIDRHLGWMGEAVGMRDIVAVAERGQLRLAVTSPTRGSLGAAAYLSYLKALAGNPQVLTQAHLQDPQLQAKARRFLSTVHREPRGAATLMRTFLSPEGQFDAIFNVEANVIKANQRLTAQGRTPLYALYPVDGLTLADSPLAYINRGDADQEQAFFQLQQALLEDESQQKIMQHGRRPGRVDVDLDAMDRSLFNPQWGIDLERPLTPTTWPSRDVIREALRMLVVQAPTPVAEAPSTIRLAAPATLNVFVLAVVLREAYARLGYRIKVTTYPPELALRWADAGREDGEVVRIDGLGKKYPNLVQLRPPIGYFEAAAFTAGQDIPIDGWNSLQPYRIGLVRGLKFAELNTEGMNRHLVRDYPALFRMLGEERIDVAVSQRLAGIYELKRLRIRGISPVEPSLERFPLYHYLHRSRADLAPKLEAEFRRMQETGELPAIRQRVIAELMRRAEKGLPMCEDSACFEATLDGGGTLE